MISQRQLRKVDNHKYIHGDFDHDRIPNIDDKMPFNKKVRDPINKEVSLSDTFKYVEERRKQAIPIAKKLARKYGAEYRVKDTYSTVNKAVRRNPALTNDFIGLRVESTERTGLLADYRRFNKDNGVPRNKVVFREFIGQDNKYVSNKNSRNLYRALHTNLLVKGFGAEVQFRTHKYGKLNDRMHLAYKRGNPSRNQLASNKKRSKYLLQKGY